MKRSLGEKSIRFLVGFLAFLCCWASASEDTEIKKISEEYGKETGELLAKMDSESIHGFLEFERNLKVVFNFKKPIIRERASELFKSAVFIKGNRDIDLFGPGMIECVRKGARGDEADIIRGVFKRVSELKLEKDAKGLMNQMGDFVAEALKVERKKGLEMFCQLNQELFCQLFGKKIHEECVKSGVTFGFVMREYSSLKGAGPTERTIAKTSRKEVPLQVDPLCPKGYVFVKSLASCVLKGAEMSVRKENVTGGLFE